MSKKILLIDDDIDVIEMNRAILMRSGYLVSAAFDGDEGFQKILAEKPDLIILDVMMNSVGEGFELARRVRSTLATRNIPIVMLSSVNREFDFNLRIGPDEDWNPVNIFLDKPVEKEILLAKVKEILKDQ